MLIPNTDDIKLVMDWFLDVWRGKGAKPTVDLILQPEPIFHQVGMESLHTVDKIYASFWISTVLIPNTDKLLLQKLQKLCNLNKYATTWKMCFRIMKYSLYILLWNLWNQINLKEKCTGQVRFPASLASKSKWVGEPDLRLPHSQQKSTLVARVKSGTQSKVSKGNISFPSVNCISHIIKVHFSNKKDVFLWESSFLAEAIRNLIVEIKVSKVFHSAQCHSFRAVCSVLLL